MQNETYEELGLVADELTRDANQLLTAWETRHVRPFCFDSAATLRLRGGQPLATHESVPPRPCSAGGGNRGVEEGSRGGDFRVQIPREEAHRGRVVACLAVQSRFTSLYPQHAASTCLLLPQGGDVAQDALIPFTHDARA